MPHLSCSGPALGTSGCLRSSSACPMRTAAPSGHLCKHSTTPKYIQHVPAEVEETECIRVWLYIVHGVNTQMVAHVCNPPFSLKATTCSVCTAASRTKTSSAERGGRASSDDCMRGHRDSHACQVLDLRVQWGMPCMSQAER